MVERLADWSGSSVPLAISWLIGCNGVGPVVYPRYPAGIPSAARGLDMLMTAPVQVGGCVVGLICIRPDDQGRMMDQGKPHPSVVVATQLWRHL